MKHIRKYPNKWRLLGVNKGILAFFALMLLLLPIQSMAQGRWIVNGAKVGIQPSTQVVVPGEFVLQDTGVTQDFGLLKVGGHFINTSSATLPFSGIGGKVELNGVANQNIGGTRVTTFEDLIVDNVAGVTHLIDAEINDTLFFTNGLVNTGAFMMRLLLNGQYSNAAPGRFVNGWMGRTFPNGVNVTRAFGIGDNLGFVPATVTYPSITTQGVLAIRTLNPDHPNLNTSTINPALSVNRYWQFRNHVQTPLPLSFNPTLSFQPGDLDIGLNTNNTVGEQLNTGVWTTQSVTGRTATSISLSGITQLGDVAVGEPGVPTANISGNSTICPGGTAVLTVTMTGNAPWTLSWTDGTVNTTQIGITANPYFITVTPASSATYTLVSVSNPTVGVVSGAAVVTRITQPTANISAAQTICQGQTATLTVALTGNSPWTLVYANGMTPVTVTGLTASPYLITVTPLTTTNYSLVSVNNGCTGTTSGFAPVTVVAVPGATLSGTQTICAGSVAQLSVALSGSTPWSLSWNDGTTNFSQSGITANPFVINVTPLTTRTYTLNSVFAACSGIISGNAAVSVVPVPSATLSGSQTVCSGSSVVLTVNLTGAAPWNLTWTDGTTPQSQTGITGSPFILTVSPAVNTTYALQNVFSVCNGSVSGNGVIDIRPIPTASISGTHTICSGSSVALSIALIGTPPFSFTYTDGTTNTTVTNVLSSPYILTVSPNISTSYSLTQVFATCAGTVSGQGSVLVVPAPTAQITGSQTLCVGTPATLTINLTGHAPWDITWTDGTTAPVAVTGISVSPYLLNVTPTSNAQYSLLSVNAVCAGTVSGLAQLTVRPVPTAALSGANTICTGGSVTLTVTLTGVSPWTIDWTDGVTNTTITGINSSPYLFTVTPASTTTFSLNQVFSTCIGTTSGTAIVQVNPVPSATLSGTQTICTGSVTTLTANFTGTAPWTFTYNSGSTPASITGITSNPFVFSVTPSVSTTYTATSVFATCAGLVTGNAQVTTSPIPSATLSGSQTICQGSNAILTVNFTGLAPWSLTYTDGTNPVSISGITASPYNLVVNPLVNTTYSLTQMNGFCPGNAIGSGIVVVRSVPVASISGSHTICSGTSVALSIALTGVPPFNFTWTDGTTNTTVTNVLSSPYILTVAPSISSTYTLTQVFASCIGSVSGQGNVLVVSVPTAQISGTQTICAGFPAQLSVTLTGHAPWNFIWTDGTTPPTNVTGISASPYLLNLTPTTNAQFSLLSVNAVCAGTVSGLAQLTVRPVPTATLSGANTICNGGFASLTAVLTGVAPWSLAWSDGFTSNTITGINATPFVFTVTPIASRTYSLTQVFATCAGTTSGTATVQVNPVPTVTLSGSQTICAGGTASLTANFTGNAPWNFTYNAGATPASIFGITSNPFVFSVTPSISTTYTASSVFATCAGLVSGNAQVTVSPIPFANLSGSQTICQGSSAILTVNFSGLPPWAMTYSDGTNLVSVPGITASPYSLVLNPLVNTSYSLTQVSGFCTGNVSGSGSILVNPIPTATITGNATICPNNPARLSIGMTGTPPWNIVWSDGVSSFTQNGLMVSPFVVNLTPSVSRTYSVTSVFATCSGLVSGTASVLVTNPPSAFMAGNTTICQGGNANIQVGISGVPPWTLTWTDGQTQTIVTGITSSPYSISITPAVSRIYNLVSVASNCNGSVAGSGVVVVNPIPSASFATTYLPVCTGQSRQVSVNLTGVQPWSITYTNGVTPVTVNNITTSPYTFTVNPVGTETYTLTNVNATCNGTYGNASVLVQPEAAPTATLSGTQTVCMLTPATLTVNFTGTGPWNIVYTDGANNYPVNGLTANPSTFQAAMGATQKTFNLVSVTGACSGLVSGTAVVDVTNKPVAVMSAPAGICQGIGGQLSVSISGIGPWNLTYTDGTNFFTENAIASSPYNWTVNPTAQVTYQLTNVTGPFCTGSVLSTPVSVPVSVQPNATLTGTQTICSGNVANLSLNMTGQAPWTAVYSNGTNSFVLSGLTADTVIRVMPMGTTTYTLGAIATNGCVGNVSGSSVVTVIPNVTSAIAGADQTICSNVFNLNANLPTVGSGQWNVIQGTGALTRIDTNVTTVTNLSVGTNILEWQITSGICVSTSQITIEVTVPPTTSNAGTDQYLCGTSTVLNGNTPVNGTGTWTVLSGMGTLVDPNDPNSPVNNLLLGQTVMEWTIVTGGCTSSSIVNIYAALSAPATSAGQDQLICSNTTTLNAMTPTVGTGYWMMASGTGMIQDTLNAQTAVTGLGLGLNSFVWITRNGGCFATDTVSVQVVQAPVAQFGLVQFGFDVDFTDQSFGGGGSYAWTFGDGGTSGDQNPHHTYLQAGVYPVRLIITNVCRSDTAYDTVRIGGVKNEDFSDNDMGIELYPNPASGGFVDLRVRGVYGDEVKVRIYSMTGSEVLTRVIDTEGRPEFTQRLELGALLSKGTYTVLLETDQGVKTEKLIVL